MKQEDLISVGEFCRHYSVEMGFIHALHRAELIEVVVIRDELYVHPDQLAHLERMARFHYDLNINLEGIEVINRLLQRIDQMHQEIVTLRNRLGRFDRFEELNP